MIYLNVNGQVGSFSFITTHFQTTPRIANSSFEKKLNVTKWEEVREKKIKEKLREKRNKNGKRIGYLAFSQRALCM